MDPRTGQAAFRIAVLILVLAALIFPFQRPGSAESVVTVMAAAVGALFVAVVLMLNRLASPPLPPRGDRVAAGAGDKPVRTSSNATNEHGRDQ